MRSVSIRCGAALVWALCACGDEPADTDRRAPAQARATLALEPPEVRVGEVAELEVAVVTPPEHRVAPLAAPESVEGFWILDSQTLPLERERWRWIQRTRWRIRTREVGRFTWPAGRVSVAAPDGSESEIAFPALDIEVVATLPERSDRLSPFGLRVPAAVPTGPAPWVAALAGAGLALAGVGLVALARRRNAAHERSAISAPPPEPPWIAARAQLAAAAGESAEDPRRAADHGAAALRHYMGARFAVATRARTTEELEGREPPFAARSRWPRFVSLLRELDELRFRPETNGSERAEAAQRVAALVERASAFVEDSIPPQERT